MCFKQLVNLYYRLMQRLSIVSSHPADNQEDPSISMDLEDYFLKLDKDTYIPIGNGHLE